MNARLLLAVLLLGALGSPPASHAAAAKSAHPVVFAHGMGGFNNILGFDYWGDDYGLFVGDPCNGFLEFTCNPYIDDRQRTFIAQVQAFESSEVRGLDLADDIEGYLATTGVGTVNIIGHSQGAIDARKAARVLYERRGYTAIKVLTSVSGPHRGSPVARYILEQGPGVTNVLDTLATYYGDTVYQEGNDGYAGTMQLIYDDFDPEDGKVTGMKAFNLAYPVDARYAARYLSVITAQDGLSVNPALFLLNRFLFDIDGNGYCSSDCGMDGIAGMGDGVTNEADDDGVVGINSQQVGYRLNYREKLIGRGEISTDFDLGFVGSVNEPTFEQATSSAPVLHQDHLDVIGVGPDTFDELGFYAALIDSIARFDRPTRGSSYRRTKPSPERNTVPTLPVNGGPVGRWLTP
jgi:pimeloyl-ACP methyl ester carboxylesterase